MDPREKLYTRVTWRGKDYKIIYYDGEAACYILRAMEPYPGEPSEISVSVAAVHA